MATGGAAGSGGLSEGGASGEGGDASGGSAGAPPGVEHCSNGTDDDGDGAVDCADDDCSEKRCVPVAPAGWSGPSHLFEGPPAQAPGCAGELASQVLRGGSEAAQQALSCTACSCGAVGTGGGTAPTCRLAGRNYEGGPGGACSTQSGSFALSTSCLVPSSVTGYVFGEFTATGGSCSAAGGQVSARPTPSWGVAARACAPTAPVAQGCPSGNVCMPRPEAPFMDAVCIVRAGEHACPAAYPNRRAYYTELDDRRSCTGCACGSPTNLSCSGTVAAYEQTNCTGARTTQFEGTRGSCQFVSNQVIDDKALRLENVTSSGSCQPTTTSTSTGTIEATGAVTVCCS